jgi:SpoVK/Ycf46/Vps4 family AAA+-type ATPase
MEEVPSSTPADLERAAREVLEAGGERGLAALFAGPAGSGKRAAARYTAGRLARDLTLIVLSGVVSKYFGETEKNLRRLFDAATASGAILLFDEADALFGKRDEADDANDSYANQVIGVLLEQAETLPVVAILAMRRPERLDPELLRRMPLMIDFPRPPEPDPAAT